MQRLAGIRRLENNARRLRVKSFQRIYKVTGPWHALCCFVTHVEARSPPVSFAAGALSHMGECAPSSIPVVANIRWFRLTDACL